MRAASRVPALFLSGLLFSACVPAPSDNSAPDPVRVGSGGSAGRAANGSGGQSASGSTGGSPAPGGSGGVGAGGSPAGSGGAAGGSGGASAGSGGSSSSGGSNGSIDANPGPKEAGGGDTTAPDNDASVAGVTFTKVWTGLLMPTCATAACHAKKSPPDGIDMNTQMAAYRTLLAKAVVKNDPGKSKMVALIEAKKMPPGGKPAVTEAQIADLKAWITAGALDN
jgi:hypothetical protein